MRQQRAGECQVRLDDEVEEKEPVDDERAEAEPVNQDEDDEQERDDDDDESLDGVGIMDQHGKEKELQDEEQMLVEHGPPSRRNERLEGQKSALANPLKNQKKIWSWKMRQHRSNMFCVGCQHCAGRVRLELGRQFVFRWRTDVTCVEAVDG